MRPRRASRVSARPVAVAALLLCSGATACEGDAGASGDGDADGPGDAGAETGPDAEADGAADADADWVADGDADGDVEADALEGDSDLDIAELIELRYDNGACSSMSSPWGETSGGRIGVSFTPPHWPVRLHAARLFVPASSRLDTEFRVRVYLADGPDGAPGTDLLPDTVDVVTARAAEGDEWVLVRLSGYDIVVDEGDLVVAMEWLTAPGDRGEDAQFLGTDESEPDRRSWWYSPGYGWIRIEEVGPGDRDAMIRAYVE